MCERCHEWHHHALDILSGGVPRGCQECGVTLDTLNAMTPGPAVRMFVVTKDGIYQVLCLTCKDAYTPKRMDLFQGTRYGEQIKL